jgi:hypothetical protein
MDSNSKGISMDHMGRPEVLLTMELLDKKHENKWD